MKTALRDNSANVNEKFTQSALWKCLEFFKGLTFSGTDYLSVEMQKRQSALINWTWKLTFTVRVEPLFGGGIMNRFHFKVNDDIFFPEWSNLKENVYDKLADLLTDDEIADLLLLWIKQEVLRKEDRISRSMSHLRFSEQDCEFRALDAANMILRLTQKRTSAKTREFLLKKLKK